MKPHLAEQGVGSVGPHTLPVPSPSQPLKGACSAMWGFVISVPSPARE